jgi:hypothetical protein
VVICGLRSDDTSILGPDMEAKLKSSFSGEQSGKDFYRR